MRKTKVCVQQGIRVNIALPPEICISKYPSMWDPNMSREEIKSLVLKSSYVFSRRIRIRSFYVLGINKLDGRLWMTIMKKRIVQRR